MRNDLEELGRRYSPKAPAPKMGVFSWFFVGVLVIWVCVMASTALHAPKGGDTSGETGTAAQAAGG